MNKLQYTIIISLFISLSSAFAEVSPETVVNIFKRLEILENKTRELHGENEVLKHQLEELKKTQKQSFLNVDQRIEKINRTSKPSNEPKEAETKSDNPDVKVINNTETDRVPEPVSAETKKTAVKTEKIAEANTVPPKDTSAATKKKSRAPNSYEKETYQAAFSLMKTSPSAASKAFKEYIKMQPESPLAANAQYWIGEIMYSHNNYKGAVQEFIKVLQKYKYSDKAPDAALKLGYSFYALKNWAYAKRTFDDVIKYFPENKNAVNLATKRLEKIKAAGH